MYTNEQFYFDVPHPDRLSRGLIFIKWLLILPHAFVMYFYGIAAGIVAFLGWFVVLFAGQMPGGMWSFLYGWLRWQARIGIYMNLLRD